jgi:hypothetical protein
LQNEERYIAALKYLMSLPEEKRDEYALQVLNAVVEGLEKALDKKLIATLFDKKSGLLDKKKPAAETLYRNIEILLNDLKENDAIIIACLMYAMKDKFREIILRVMDALSSIAPPHPQNLNSEKHK